MFFDDVRVPAGKPRRRGEPRLGHGQGAAWVRTHLPRLRTAVRLRAGPTAAACRADGSVAEEPAFADRYTQFRLDLADHKALFEVYAEKLRSGETLGPDVSLLKIHQSELYQRITETMLDISGENAGLLDPIGGNRELHPSGMFIQARPVTIYGGSSEIQRTIIAKNVLGLPG